MSHAKTRIVNIKKFKEWVSSNLHRDSPLYQVVQREHDELPLEEAVAQTEMICALIDASVSSKTLLKRGSTS
ncbi:MAG: hypothetical protein JRN52_07255 [Nitrososphaerota archaeon]|nr:hypothetical protein [Nitrososphaerota archaeon]